MLYLSRFVILFFNFWINSLFCFSPVTLFELTVVNNWYITMVRSSLVSALYHQSPLCRFVIDQWVSPFDCCLVRSPTGRSNFHDEPLEPALLHDLLHSYHGEACVVVCARVFLRFVCGSV